MASNGQGERLQGRSVITYRGPNDTRSSCVVFDVSRLIRQRKIRQFHRTRPAFNDKSVLAQAPDNERDCSWRIYPGAISRLWVAKVSGDGSHAKPSSTAPAKTQVNSRRALLTPSPLPRACSISFRAQ